MSPELRDFISCLLDRNVLQRLDVAAAMAHPWVTAGGSAPLTSIPQQQLQGTGGGCGAGSNGSDGVLVASQEEIDAAVRLAGGGVSELMDVVFAEKQLRPG